MGTVSARVTDAGVQQAEVTIREAATLAGVSTKTTRKLIKAGDAHATMRRTRSGNTYFVDASTLAIAPGTLEGGKVESGQGRQAADQSHEGDLYQGQDRAGAGLLSMLQDLQRRHEAAVGRIGYLEAMGGVWRRPPRGRTRRRGWWYPPFLSAGGPILAKQSALRWGTDSLITNQPLFQLSYAGSMSDNVRFHENGPVHHCGPRYQSASRAPSTPTFWR